MPIRRWIRNFFAFSRAEINGFILLIPLAVIIVFSEPFYRWWQSSRPVDFAAERARLDSLSAFWIQQEINQAPEEDDLPVMRFHFNPNSATEEELIALGFSAGLARRLINYRNSGGQFRWRSDMLKLYGMDSSFFQSLEPWIALPAAKEPAEEPSQGAAVKPTVREVVRFNLNHADTALLKTIYGIGSRLSARIVNYRNSLGGFLLRDQLYEVYGLDSTVIGRLMEASFIEDDFYPRTLNINTASEDELAIHPYISRRMARAMVTYRFQHGKYQSVEDLRKILQFDENQLNKLRPYLAVGE
jgi:competence protein ComEA